MGGVLTWRACTEGGVLTWRAGTEGGSTDLESMY